MKPVATLVAIPVLVITLLVLVGLGFAPAARASASTAVRPDQAGPLRLDLTDLSPRVVTSSGPTALTITGTLTNTGAVPVEQLVVRVQRSDPLTSDGEVRDALDAGAGTDAVTPQFVPLAGELAPGAQIPVRLSVPLRGAPETSLALGRPGVHELLVNVNGAPQGGDRARLAAQRMLLPVLSLPPSAGVAAVTPDDAPAEAPPSRASAGMSTSTPFSMLYPITDTPRRLSTVPGEPVLLTDDTLATSFGPDGRLGGLVSALAALAPLGSRVRDATCLAVDPDLVETAALMRTGYDVLGPDGVPAPGAGAQVAGQWIDQLVAAARGGCVIALPYADADLVALTRAGLPDAAATAVTDGRRVLAGVLQTAVQPDLTWPAGGVVDEATLDVIGRTGAGSLVLSADGVESGRSRPNSGVVPVADGRTTQTALLTDPLLTLAAGGPTATTTTAAGTGGAGTGGAAAIGSPAGTDTPLSTQDVIGALVYRAQGSPAQGADGPLVLAPPQLWAADGVGARALLAAADQLLAAGNLAATNPAAALTAGPRAGTEARAVDYPLTSGSLEVPASVLDTIRATAQSIADLRSVVVPGSGVGVSTDEMFAPLDRGLVRPASATFRARPEDAAAAASAGAARVDVLRSAVRVLEPPSPYSLGTSDAPLPLTVANGLPITVEVRVEIASTSGLRVAPIGPVQVPPLGRRQVSVNAQVTRSGQFTIDARVLTPDGGTLGPASRLKVRSTAYGTITVWLTVGAGALLVVLAVRRVVRRIRGEPGRHTGPSARTDPTPPPRPEPPPGNDDRPPYPDPSRPPLPRRLPPPGQPLGHPDTRPVHPRIDELGPDRIGPDPRSRPGPPVVPMNGSHPAAAPVVPAAVVPAPIVPAPEDIAARRT